MTERRNDSAAWQAARQWQERARRARPSTAMSGPKLVMTWLLFGVMMILGTVIGLFFLLVGWLMLPLVRRRMKKRMEQMRADQATDIDEGFYADHRPGGTQQVLEGDYQVKE
ncbi:hypothetical protein FGL86_07460 [Pistricoccus aurantiacus]|uniref:Uncharacterized protein n=1 Tax=Pistricoccus aurantiacus TaxID=1883414 RepID=A0A5B8STZ5_9GAMM|nr:hypothetical protein [Pistricoccus aurantiacus]QEA38925.1 hypothetical protein FGL86_07460 [Pistricoccus aurantiacus]